jgi:hypothetical protein
MFFTRTQKEHT